LVGVVLHAVGMMTVGFFIFGLGINPLAVVQETIIVRLFSSSNLGISLAVGLLAGKGSSFLAALTSYPLAEQLGLYAPFFTAAFLSAVSFGINLVYLYYSGRIARGAGVDLDGVEPHGMEPGDVLRRVAEKEVKFSSISKLGDAFWVYIALNRQSTTCYSLCYLNLSPQYCVEPSGAHSWLSHRNYPAARYSYPITSFMVFRSILQQRYSLSESIASNQASILLAGNIVFYPLVSALSWCLAFTTDLTSSI
jgi:hypothetical protein